MLINCIIVRKQFKPDVVFLSNILCFYKSLRILYYVRSIVSINPYIFQQYVRARRQSPFSGTLTMHALYACPYNLDRTLSVQYTRYPEMRRLADCLYFHWKYRQSADLHISWGPTFSSHVSFRILLNENVRTKNIQPDLTIQTIVGISNVCVYTAYDGWATLI